MADIIEDVKKDTKKETKKDTKKEVKTDPVQVSIKEESPKEDVKKGKHPFANYSKEQLLGEIERLESEVTVLQHRLTRANARGVPRGMGRG